MAISRTQHYWCTINLLLYRLKSEVIAQKLKQLSSKIQMNEQGFLRDAFRVTSSERNAEYLIHAIEYYSAVQFYPNSNRMMKLFEWKVYKLPSLLSRIGIEDIQNLEFVAQYNLERSQSADGTPTHVFGRTNIEDAGHVSIVNYGTEPGPTVDGYYHMKLLVIEDLKLLKGLPILARTIRNPEIGIDTVIFYGHSRQIEDGLGYAVVDAVLYDDDLVMTFDRNTGRETCQCGPMNNQIMELDVTDCFEFCRRPK